MKRALSALALLASTVAQADDVFELPTVTVVGERAYDNPTFFYSQGKTISNSFRAELLAERSILKFQVLSPDVRCNPLAASNLLQSTTSNSDGDTKFLAANTLFRLIYAKSGSNGMQAAINLLPIINSADNGSKMVLWKTTWNDGSSSTFLIFPFTPPLFTNQQPQVGGDSPASGKAGECPAKG